MIVNKKQAINDFMARLYKEEHKDENGFLNKYYSPLTKSHYLSKTEAKNHYVEYHRENLVIHEGDVFELDVLAHYMDDDLRETVHSVMIQGDSAQKFFNLYCELHYKKYKENFEIN